MYTIIHTFSFWRGPKPTAGVVPVFVFVVDDVATRACWNNDMVQGRFLTCHCCQTSLPCIMSPKPFILQYGQHRSSISSWASLDHSVPYPPIQGTSSIMIWLYNNIDLYSLKMFEKYNIYIYIHINIYIYNDTYVCVCSQTSSKLPVIWKSQFHKTPPLATGWPEISPERTRECWHGAILHSDLRYCLLPVVPYLKWPCDK